MITHAGRPTNTRDFARAAALGAFMLMLAGCGDEGDPVDPGGRLCGGETGLGLLIEGRADPLEFCVDDPDVSVVLTSQNRYDVQAQVSNGAGVFVVRMVFAVRAFPATLRVTEDLSEAVSDTDAVWLYYEEIPAGGDPIESFVVDQGSFTLSFVDEDVATGVLSGVVLDMRDFTTGDPAGRREFSEGVFSISTKEPTAASRVAASAR
ncbi:MAG: hypothetical protein L0Z51_06145 [Candidatus Latescibacteria bacterium]|nr:hypothetical protein [Candidatus Latescibacterota bacterium]